MKELEKRLRWIVAVVKVWVGSRAQSEQLVRCLKALQVFPYGFIPDARALQSLGFIGGLKVFRESTCRRSVLHE